MVEGYGQAIPVVLVIDKGFVVAKENSGSPTGGWDEFDSIVLATAKGGEAEDFQILQSLRLTGQPVRYSPWDYCSGFGLLLTLRIPNIARIYLILCQFSTKEDELMEAGKLRVKNASALDFLVV